MTDIPSPAPVTAEAIKKDFADALLTRVKTKNPQTPVDIMKAISEEADFIVEYLLAHPGQEAVVLESLLNCFDGIARGMDSSGITITIRFESILLRDIICKLAALAGKKESPADANATSETNATVDAQCQAIGENLLGSVAGK